MWQGTRWDWGEAEGCQGVAGCLLCLGEVSCYQDILYQHWEPPGSDKFIAVRNCLKMTKFASCKHQLQPAAKGSQEQMVNKASWQLYKLPV